MGYVRHLPRVFREYVRQLGIYLPVNILTQHVYLNFLIPEKPRLVLLQRTQANQVQKISFCTQILQVSYSTKLS
jgi:hypothetical protein